MNREEAAEALQLIRRVVAQARDDSALQNWGVIWILHAFTNGGGFLGTHVLYQQGHRAPGPYVLLWGVIVPINLLSSLGMTQVPHLGFALLGAMWFVTQLTGGLLLHRARRRRLAAGSAQARLV